MTAAVLSGKSPKMEINKIVIGDRARKDMGDLLGLANSMKRHGLLHPVVVKKDRTLIAGHRRIEAARVNGWKDIAVTVIEVEDLLSAERDENTERKDFTPTEAVAIGRLIEDQEKPKAEQRHREGSARGGSKAGSGNKPKAGTRDIVSRAVGMSGTNYYKAKAIVVAAESDPAKFGDLTNQMDATGNVTGAHKEMKRRNGVADKNGKKPRHPVHRKMHYPKPNRAVERATWALAGICDALDKVDAAELDAAKVRGWVDSLKKGAARINQITRRFLNG